MAQAPITVDGKLAATEVAANGYQLVGRDTGARGFGDAGVLALYAAADANNLYFFLVGTLESSATEIKNSLQVFIDRPGVDGIPVGTALPLPADPTSGPATSFQKMNAKLDLAADLGVAIKGTGAAGQVQMGAVVYTPGTTPTATAMVASGSTPLNAVTGAAFTVPASTTGTFAPFAGAQVAYLTSANLSSNPGFATNGNAPANGLEIVVSRSAMGIPATGGQVRIFALQNNQDGGFISSDYIPQGPADAANPGSGADFTAIAGTQAATLTVTASGLSIVTSNRNAAAAALKFGVYPNPAPAAATIDYVVAGQQNVSLDVFNSLGQRVRTVASGTQSGKQSYPLTNLTAGAYFVKLRVGDQMTSQKVVVE
ncbi:T9SS type A sorting domain-containing protein [Hymenobacter glacieicola]|nr:T9SS type A sorting domain-containing protein [Hymenobacter glacieicola]